jgi:glycosyltransferase involved in cell wall biosynthesis
VGGAEQAAYRLAMLARDNGHSVSFLTTRSDRAGEPEFAMRSVPIVEDYSPAFVRKYVEAAKWYAVQYDPLAVQAFKGILAEAAPDVVHFHNFQFLTLGLLKPAKRAGITTVLSIYDYWLFCPTVMLVAPDNTFCSRAHGPWCIDCLPSTLRSFQKILLSIRRRIIDHYLAMVDRFHVLSHHSRSVLEGYGIPSHKIHVASLTLPLEYANTTESGNSVDPDMILFAGWLNKRKGIHRLLEAMPLVLKEHPSARLTAIGGRVRFGAGC